MPPLSPSNPHPSQAARLTLVQILMNSKGLAMNPLQSLYYVSPACLLCLLVPFALVEYSSLIQSPPVIYPTVLLANALTAFALNLAVFLLIGKTSALTMNIAGVIKDWMLIFFSFHLFHAPVTVLNLVGYAFCVAGVAVYNFQKLQVGWGNRGGVAVLLFMRVVGRGKGGGGVILVGWELGGEVKEAWGH